MQNAACGAAWRNEKRGKRMGNGYELPLAHLYNKARLAQIYGVSTDYLLGVNERLTVDITNLDELQKQAVTLMIRLFKRDNKSAEEQK